MQYVIVPKASHGRTNVRHPKTEEGHSSTRCLMRISLGQVYNHEGHVTWQQKPQRVLTAKMSALYLAWSETKQRLPYGAP